MAADVDIVNLAAGRLGHAQAIGSLNDRGVVAERSKILFPLVRDRLLQQYEWPWATRIVALAASADPAIPGWTYLYTYPEKCLSLDAVCDEAGARTWARPISALDPRRGNLPRQPYRLFAGEDATVVATDVANAYGVMRWQVTNPDLFPPLFVSGFGWAMAAELAPFLKVRADLIQYADKMAVVSMIEAAAASLNEDGDDEQPETPSILARG